jgi:hypothetical protein
MTILLLAALGFTFAAEAPAACFSRVSSTAVIASAEATGTSIGALVSLAPECTSCTVFHQCDQECWDGSFSTCGEWGCCNDPEAQYNCASSRHRKEAVTSTAEGTK